MGLLVLSSCGGGGSDLPASTSSGSGLSQNRSATCAACEVESAQTVIGTWSKGCKKTSATTSSLTFLTFQANGTYESHALRYTSSTDCTGNYSTRAKKSGSFTADSDSIKMVSQKDYITLYDDADVQHANQEKRCKHEDWKSGVEVECTTSGHRPVKGNVKYQRVDKKMYFQNCMTKSEVDEHGNTMTTKTCTWDVVTAMAPL